MPELARLFSFQAKEYAAVEARLEEIDAKLMKWHRADDLTAPFKTSPEVR
ncbi:hypothetical protein ACFQU7_43470 [Pseudoroseomonas wenyumeiae]